MSFVQIMEVTTASRFNDIRDAVEAWESATEGRRTVKSSVICQDRDTPSRWVIIVTFDSYEDAMKNSELPETKSLADLTAGLADEPLRFSNLDVVEERL